MTMTNGQIAKLKALAEGCKTLTDRTKGCIEQIDKRLAKEHDCHSVKEAKKKLAKLKEDLAKMEAKLEEQAGAFQQAFGDKM